MKIIFLYIVILLYASLLGERPGLVIATTVDLIGHSLIKDYMPVAGSAANCPRMHQLLFNETVEIIQETESAYRIRIPHLFFITASGKTPHTGYWAEKKNILAYNAEKQKEIIQCIPYPIDFNQPMIHNSSTIVLTKPWFSKLLQMTFSAGTRFVLTGKNNRSFYTVNAWHPEQEKTILLKIPKNIALLQTERSKDEALTNYVNLLKSWAHTPGYIPYVWGGCSFIYTHPRHALFSHEMHNETESYNIHGDTHKQKAGFDCAGLIARAAQSAGLPYYFKNTATLAAYLKPVSSFNELNEGDLIWIPGHVMAISDIKKGTLIEARHYSQGYGKIHEIALNKVFKGIHSYQDLFTAVESGTVLERLDSSKYPIQRVAKCKLLSMRSCWQT